MGWRHAVLYLLICSVYVHYVVSSEIINIPEASEDGLGTCSLPNDDTIIVTDESNVYLLSNSSSGTIQRTLPDRAFFSIDTEGSHWDGLVGFGLRDSSLIFFNATTLEKKLSIDLSGFVPPKWLGNYALAENVIYFTGKGAVLRFRIEKDWRLSLQGSVSLSHPGIFDVALVGPTGKFLCVCVKGSNGAPSEVALFSSASMNVTSRLQLESDTLFASYSNVGGSSMIVLGEKHVYQVQRKESQLVGASVIMTPRGGLSEMSCRSSTSLFVVADGIYWIEIVLGSFKLSNLAQMSQAVKYHACAVLGDEVVMTGSFSNNSVGLFLLDVNQQRPLQ